MDREARRRCVPCLGYVTQPIEIGPGALGVDMVGGDRGDTAPSLTPASRRSPKSSERFGGAGRGRRAAGSSGRAQLRRDSRRGGRFDVVHRRAGLGRKFWTITSWTWPCAGGSRRSPRAPRCGRLGSRRCRRGFRRVGDLQFAGPLEVSSRRAGTLSGALGGVEIATQGLEHHSLARRDRRRSASSSRFIAPVLPWGSRPVSSRTSCAMAAT